MAPYQRTKDSAPRNNLVRENTGERGDSLALARCRIDELEKVSLIPLEVAPCPAIRDSSVLFQEKQILLEKMAAYENKNEQLLKSSSIVSPPSSLKIGVW